VQTSLGECFEVLTGWVALIGPEKLLRKTMCVSVIFLQKSLKAAGRQSVN